MPHFESYKTDVDCTKEDPLIPIGMKRYVRVLTLSFAIALLGHIVVSAQSGPTGTLSGTVKDPSGALMPGVDITIRNTGTGQTRKAASDNVGRWVAPALAVGTYQIS